MAEFLKKLNKVQKGDMVTDTEDRQHESLVKAMESVVYKRDYKVRSGVFPVHVSTAVNFCSRQHYLIEKAGQEFKKKAYRADEVLWAIGKAIEKLNRDTLIEAYGSHNCFGIWTCLCKRTEMVGLGKNPFNTKCQHCQTSVTHTYNEYPIFYKDVMVGNPDLMVVIDGKLHVVEIKSIQSEDFKKLVSPSATYKMQAYSYLRLLEYKKAEFKEQYDIEIDLKSFTILYTSKGYQFFGSVDKAFKVEVDKLPTTFKKQFDDTMYEIVRTKTALEIPKRCVCDSPKSAQAKECCVVAECFSYS